MYFCSWKVDNSEKIVVLADPQMEGYGRVYYQGLFGKINNQLNDFYYRFLSINIQKYLKPNYVFVIGDIFSHHQIPQDDFLPRIERFNYIFNQTISKFKMVQLSGNHDVGYGIEQHQYFFERFKHYFGPLYQKIEFKNNIIAVIDSMVLDGSAIQQYQEDSWNFLKLLATEANDRKKKLFLFTHVPLYKPKGNCVDDPTCLKKNGFVYQQNMLSKETSTFILEKIKPNLIISGHDHEGCTYDHTKHLREYTLRSVMGEFGGNIGMFEFNDDEFNFQTCSFGNAKYVFTLVVVSILITIYNFICIGLFGGKKEKVN